MVEIAIKGLAELERALQQLPDKLERNVVRGALKAAGKPIADDAKARVAKISGDLRKSIRVSTRVVKGKPVAYVKAGSKEAFYAHMVEGGTTAHFIRPKHAKSLFIAGLMRTEVSHPGARKRPFLRPAMDTQSGAAVQAFAAHVRARLTKEGINVPESIPEDSE